MEKIANFLHNMAMHGNQEADDLYWEIKDLDTAAFSRWVLDNDERLRAVIPFKSIMEEPSEEEKALLSEYIGARNAGVKAYTGDKKTDVYGRPLKGLDEFMRAFGVKPSNDVELRDNDRSAFTNPENPNYWEKRPYSDKVMAAYNLGYGTVDEMENDLRRTGSDYQRANQVEGYGPNNEKQPWEWIKSAAKGLALPRTKEAQVSGREPTIQDYAGDAIETGVSLVPGFGLFSKGGRVMRGAGMVLDNAGVPLATNLVDSKLLYNPNTFGTPTSGLNPRSEFDPTRVATQAAGIVTSKGALKGTAMMGKEAFEKFYGSKAGGDAFRSTLSFIENIGENTDDLIARRQAVLDRKAELAKRAENTKFNDDIDIATANPSHPEDLYNADNYRILTEEAQRIADSEAERKAYRKAKVVRDQTNAVNSRNWVNQRDMKQAGTKYEKLDNDPNATMTERIDALNELAEANNRAILGNIQDLKSPEYIRAANSMSEEELKKIEQAYKEANERGAKDIVQLPDGRFIYADRLTNPIDGDARFSIKDFTNEEAPGFDKLPDKGYAIEYPGANYRVDVPTGTRPVVFAYDVPGLSHFSQGDLFPSNGGVSVSRNPAVIEKIQADDLVKRKLNTVQNPTYKLPSEKLHIGPQAIRLDRIERPRDIAASWGFNAASREGVLGRNNTASIDEKRERAIWNKMLNALSPLTTNPELPVETRKRNADAIMNVMQYGLDGLPVEIFLQAPETYHRIAKELKVDNWKHFSERDIQPTNSSSRAD